MTSAQANAVDPADLPAALYLNQRIVFDTLASYEGGFSQLKEIQISSGTTDSKELGGEAKLGTGNVFALLGISLGASGKKAKSETDSQVVTEQRVHTPTSLFARLRQHLKANGILNEPTEETGLTDIAPGDFVEMKLVLRRSPLVATLTGFSRLIPLMTAIESDAPSSQGKGGQGARKASGASPIKKQIEAVLEAVTSEGSEDLIGEGVAGITVVLTAERSYFVDPTLNDVIDGEFHVLGKVARVVSGADGQAISLLRKTPLGIFGDQVLQQFSDAFQQLAQSGLSIPSFQTKIEGPAIQIIPIAIFA
jgi:hypothetical protein